MAFFLRKNRIEIREAKRDRKIEQLNEKKNYEKYHMVALNVQGIMTMVHLLHKTMYETSIDILFENSFEWFLPIFTKCHSQTNIWL